MTSLEKRRAMSESRVLDISALLEPLRRDAVAGGSFGDVFQYRHRDGRLCAVKSLRPHAINVEDPHALTKAISREAQHWHDLTHPNILPMLGVCFRDDIGLPSLVSPWKKNGDARKYFEDPLNREKLDFIKFISRVAYAIAYLHSKDIVHGDIRGPNILIDDDGEPCIADLGFAKVVSKVTSSMSSSGWPAVNSWSPPEYCSGMSGSEGLKPEKSADVFSFGATAIELWTGNNPFSEFANPLRMMMHFAAGRPLPPPPKQGQREFQQHKDPVHEVYNLCCDVDPTNRPAMATVAHMLVSNRSVQNDFIKEEEEEEVARLRPSGHSQVDDDGVSHASYDSSTVVPQTEADDHHLPEYLNRARVGYAMPTMQGRIATPAPPIPRSSVIKREESDSDILTDAFGHRTPLAHTPSSSPNNGGRLDGQRQQSGSPRPLFSSPNPMSPGINIGDGYLPASLKRYSPGSPGSSHFRGSSPGETQDRSVDLRVLPPPPSPTRSESTTISRMTVLNNHCARQHQKLEVSTNSVGPPHMPSWSSECIIDGTVYGKVANMSKSKDAQEEAARLTLTMLQAQEAPIRERYLPMFNDHLRANNIEDVFSNRQYDKGGSDHQPIWLARFIINGEDFASGSDGKKADAEERAAREAARRWRSLHQLPA